MRLKPVLTLQGVGRYKLTHAALQGLPIPLPPLEEQQRITCIIRHWTKAVERLDLLVRAKEQLRTGRIQRLLNGKWRLKRFMSQHWTPRLFGSFLTESRISGSDGASARKITVRLYGKGICRKEELRQGSEETQYYTRRAGQLIYSKLDFLNGAFAIVPASLDGYETTLDLPAFDIDTTTMDARWLLYYLTQKRFYTRHLGLAHGGRKARRVNQGAFLGIVEPIPSKDEQTAIADLLSAADCEIEQLRQLLDAIKRQKRGLMQKLLTGQIPVKV
jgi:type I restriction enzyme S subunit